MKLIVGLGNHLKKYEKTKHNAGFLAVDYFCKKRDLEFKNEKFSGLFFKNDEFIIAKPQTLMNCSGNCVSQIVNFFKIDISDVLIIYDDINYDIGNFVYSIKGSSGGHNGIESIINSLATKNIKRIKIGIGKKTSKSQILSDYVLSKFTDVELSLLNSSFENLDKMIEEFLQKSEASSFYKKV
ncbi:MAG: aminoacyl-tRNA hydrolase [Mycoplasmataceae bacterium]|jgi:PTH1 family peptidyl-tRNA hydrolase|nr:aminoacyl-tRNA hydrolase [Mycoplasmataceae bacterium]